MYESNLNMLCYINNIVKVDDLKLNMPLCLTLFSWNINLYQSKCNTYVLNRNCLTNKRSIILETFFSTNIINRNMHKDIRACVGCGNITYLFYTITYAETSFSLFARYIQLCLFLQVKRFQTLK